MKKNNRLLKFLLVAVSVASPCLAAKQPNVIFILSDDQRFDSLNMTGERITETPNLDQLASEGVFFNKAFVTSPICGPSRANIFTGQWERKNRIGFPHVSKAKIKQDVFEDSFLMQLKGAGYSTAFLGKHHTEIVDRHDTPLKENIDFCYYAKGHLGFHPEKKFKVFRNLKAQSQTEALFEAFQAYLKPKENAYFYENIDASFKDYVKPKGEDKPFCAWINLNLPHQASLGGMGSRPGDPDFYSSRYADQLTEFQVPEGYPNNLKVPAEVIRSEEQPNYYQFSEKGIQQTKMKTARAVYGIDLFIGNLRKMLEELQLAENTIIVFFSDNGLLYGEHGLGGKTMLYEESVHVPLIVYSPFLAEGKRGVRRDELVAGQDIPATLLDMCGLAVPEPYQGMSMLPLLEGEKVEWRKDIFLENLFTDQGYPRQDAIRGERFKYIRYYSKDDDRKQYLPDGIEGEEPIYEELFDLQADPKEQRNLAYDKEYLAVLKEKRKRCLAVRDELKK